MKAISINCNSLIGVARRRELEFFLAKHKPQLVCLNETKLSSKHYLKIPNYTIFRADSRATNSGGTAILINNNINYSKPRTIIRDNFSATLVQIGEGVGSFLLISIYFWLINPNDLAFLFNLSERVVICGDFNAKHSMWNCHSENSNGKSLFEFCEHSNVQISIPSTATRGTATLDLVISKNVCIKEGVTALTEFCSDHLPVVFNILENNNFFKQSDSIRTPDYFNADWSSFRHYIHYKIIPFNGISIESKDEIDLRINLLSQITNTAFNKFVPLTQVKTTQLPPVIIQLIKIRNYFKNQYRKTPTVFSPTLINRTTKQIQYKIKEFSQTTFRKKLEKITPDKSNLYKSIKLIKPSNKATILLEDNDGPIIDPLIIADKVADYYEAVFSGVDHKIDSHVVNSVQNFVIEQPPIHNSDNLSTNVEEVIGLVRKLKNRKSPGIDGISNWTIKNLPISGFLQLVTIINAMFKYAYFPDNWKLSKVIVIPKPGKPNKPEFTRPISLLSGLSKIAERVISIRLLESCQHLIPEFQFGFVNKRSSTDAIMRLLNHFKNSKRRRKTSAAIFLDIQKAFDSVWHSGLLYKLIKGNISATLVMLIKSYLSNRRFLVNIENVSSNIKKMVAGVPQGSVLGPLLYVIFTHDIPLPTTQDTKLQVFADDTAVFCSSYSAFQCSNRLQLYINQLTAYFNKWNIKVNEAKTLLVYFYPTYKYNNKLKKAVPIYINNQRIKVVDNAKYLGVVFNKHLNFNNHLKHLRKQSAAAFRTLYPVLCCDSGLDSSIKLLIYKLYIRPIVTYAAPAWYDLLTNSQKSILQKIQNKALRFVLNKWPRPPSLKHYPIHSLHEQANIQSLNEYIKTLHTQVILKLLTSLNNTQVEIAHSY